MDTTTPNDPLRGALSISQVISSDWTNANTTAESILGPDYYAPAYQRPIGKPKKTKKQKAKQKQAKASKKRNRRKR